MICRSTRPQSTLFITGLGMGGAETQFVRLAVGLRARGWGVRVLTLLPPEHFAEQLAAAEVTVTSFGVERGRARPRVLFDLLRELRDHRPDVLVTFLFHPNVLGRLVGRMTGLRVVNSIRGERFGGAVRERVVRWTSGLPSHVVVNSSRAFERLVRDGLVEPKTASVIRNGLDVGSYQKRSRRRSTRASLGVAEDEFLWLAVGRLEYPKDYPMLLRSFAAAAATRPEFRLAIVGVGPDRADLEAAVEGLGLSGRVRFLGVRSDVPDLLAAADGFAFASENEGLPNVVMEALAAGLPVVATSVGGVPELVRDGETGWLVPPRDGDAFARTLERVAGMQPEARRRTGDAGAAFVDATFGLNTYIDQWEQLLYNAP